jgi:hypothetical protein
LRCCDYGKCRLESYPSARVACYQHPRRPVTLGVHRSKITRSDVRSRHERELRCTIVGVQNALEMLDGYHRELVNQRYFLEFTLQEMAGYNQKPLATVDRHVKQAFAELRKNCQNTISITCNRRRTATVFWWCSDGRSSAHGIFRF